MEIAKSILMLLGGLGVFLVGLSMMSDNLESLAGNKLKVLINKISSNRFAGVSIGAITTATIQSSSATTVMVVGFVNAGVFTLFQATSIIMGANIGTTITAWVASLSGLQGVPITEILASLACIGAFMMLSKKSNVKSIGQAIAGIGVIFIGLYLMSNSMKHFSNNPIIYDIFQKYDNPLFLLLLGALITAVIQSSSATTSILIVMGIGGLISMKSAIFVTLGINIGTCATALLASIGTNTNAKRASLIHLLFNCIGCIVFFIIALLTPIEKLLVFFFKEDVAMQIALFHTIFNVATTLLLLPFIKQLTSVATFLIKDKDTADGTVAQTQNYQLKYLDDRLVATPSIAMLMARKEILHMAGVAKQNLDLSINAIINLDLTNTSEFDTREEFINFANKSITKYLVNISAERISLAHEKELSTYYHVISDIERVGDYAEHIMEYTKKLIATNVTFSETAKSEILELNEKVNELYNIVMTGFANKDISSLSAIRKIENSIDEMREKLAQDHVTRLENQQCNTEAGVIFLSLIANMERIGNHLRNVYYSMKSYVQPPVRQNAKVKTDTKKAKPSKASK